MRKLILTLVAALTVSACGCRMFCDDRDRRNYTPVSRTAPAAPGAPSGR